jgi:predicted membrane metal-binding protein
MAALLTAWSIGIMAAVLLSPLRVWLALALGIAVAVVAIDRRLALVAGLSLAALLIGAGRGVLAATVELPPNLAGQEISVSGVIDDDPVDRKGSRRLTIHLDHLATGATQTPSDLRIEARVYGMTPLHYGDLVLLSGEVQRPPRFDQFDYRAFLAEQGVAGVMPSARLVRVTAHGGDPLHTALLALRHAVIEAVDRALPEPQAALLLGVVFGYRAALPPLLQQQMIASGLIHIVVISGLKVSLLARIIHQGLGRWLPKAAPLIAVGAMVGYALLAGASAAALRAAAMGILVVIAGRLRRDSQVFVLARVDGGRDAGAEAGPRGRRQFSALLRRHHRHRGDDGPDRRQARLDARRAARSLRRDHRGRGRDLATDARQLSPALADRAGGERPGPAAAPRGDDRGRGRRRAGHPTGGGGLAFDAGGRCDYDLVPARDREPR